MASFPDLGIEGIDDLASLDIEGSAIFRAREVRHHRLVAIKILDTRHEPLLPPRRLDPRRRPLQTFAETEGVVPVYRTGRTRDGDRYLMTPYYRAGSLADQLAYGSTPWHASAELVARIAEVLAHGHSAGVVLTGIKPSSILLADATSPVLSVYGMATRRLDDGRPSYRAPETGRSAPTPAADVYSLGLTLAALIAGRPPEGGLPKELMPEVEAVAPARIVEVITKATAENPVGRHRSAGELAVVLSAAVGGDQLPDQPPPPGTAEAFDLDALLAPHSIRPNRSTAPATRQPVNDPRPIHKSPPPLPAGASTSMAGTKPLVDLVDLTTAATDDTDSIDLRTPAEPSSSPLPPPRRVIDPPPPKVVTPIGQLVSPLSDDDVPFRPFDRQHVPTPTPNRFVHLLDPLQATWLQVRRSLGALLAVITLLVIAVIVAILVLKQRQPTPGQIGANATFTTEQEDGSPSTFAPTNVAPVFLEPPATHQTTTSRRTARSSNTLVAASSSNAPRAPTPAAASPTTSPSSPTTAPASNANPPARPASTASTASPTTLAPAPGPITASVSASRLRRTSARIRVTSSTCVTTSFTYSAAGGAGGTVSGGSRCATSHTLNLGRVTAALVPGTTYTVQVTATAQDGRSTRSQVTFTTLG